MSFWQNLPKPIVGLSPMDGITDEPMRFIQKKYGRPAVVFTEFINVEHIPHKPEKLMERFIYSDIERPIVAQLSGHTPDLFYQPALIAAYLGFDGIDINMGCPVKSVTSGGGGAALIDNHPLSREIVLIVKKAIDDWQGGVALRDAIKDRELIGAVIETRNRIMALSGHKIGSNPKKWPNTGPIGLSVKTRLAKDSRATVNWIDFLSHLPVGAITLHGRRLGQGRTGPVRWDEIAQGAKIAKRKGKIFLGNGGVRSREEVGELQRRFGVDGVLIGQAALGNPWIFGNHRPDKEERLAVMLEHAEYFDRIFGPKAFIAMRKHFGWYCRDFKDAKRLKQILLKVKTLNQARAVVEMADR